MLVLAEMEEGVAVAGLGDLAAVADLEETVDPGALEEVVADLEEAVAALALVDLEEVAVALVLVAVPAEALLPIFPTPTMQMPTASPTTRRRLV